MPQLDELATTAAVLHPDKYSSRTDSEGGRGAAGSALRKKFPCCGFRAVITGVLGGCFLEIGVCFLHNATQREIKEATKSHRRKTTAARFCVSRKNGGLLAEKQAPPKNGGVLVFPVRTALRVRGQGCSKFSYRYRYEYFWVQNSDCLEKFAVLSWIVFESTLAVQ